MRAGRLRHLIILQEPISSRSRIKQYTDSGLMGPGFFIFFQYQEESITSYESMEKSIPAYASIEPVSSRSRIIKHQYYLDTTHEVTLRYSSDIVDINNSWRISFGSRIFIITGVIDVNEHNQTILLHCKEGLREKNEPTV